MSLYPPSFLEDLKAQTDIVAVVTEATPLRKAGTSWKGLCPFHQERTPSFTVNPDKGIFVCFGCGAKGDAIKFVQLQQKVSFPEAVRHLATRAGMLLPDTKDGPEERAAAAERESLVKLHEQAAAFYQAQLATPAGSRARRELESRGLTAETIKTFGYGYSPAGGRETLYRLFQEQKVPVPLLFKSGLFLEQDGGRLVDRFRNRLMIPIARDTGAIVAFGARALEEGQKPKYINSSETPIYSKGRTLYGLDVTKGAVRKQNYGVLVEGYFDLAQVWQAGVQSVVALCGTALTGAQARTLKRFTSKVVLSFDPDSAGQGAAARSSELLVAEGFQVNVALLPAGSDPDTFIRKAGGRAYAERLTASRPYLDFLLDRAATGLDLNRPDSRKTFLDRMLTVAATIPDAAARDQFADKLAHKARITEAVVRDEIRKAAGQRKTVAPAVAVPVTARLLPAEQGLLWTLVHHPVEGMGAVAQLGPEDLIGLVTAPILTLAASLGDVPPDVLPELLRERLTEAERAWLDRASQAEAAAAPAAGCVQSLRRMRIERDLAGVQREIDQLQEASPIDDRVLTSLWERKKELLQQLEALA